MLILCEARICVLSRCICLEAIRIQDGRIGLVNDLLTQIYVQDAENNRLLPSPPEKYAQVGDQIGYHHKQFGGGEEPVAVELAAIG